MDLVAAQREWISKDIPNWPRLIADRLRGDLPLEHADIDLGPMADTNCTPHKYDSPAGVWVVKFRENRGGDGKVLITEQIVGGLARLLSAPVPETSLIFVSEDLEPWTIPLREGAYAAVGIHHGSRFIERCSMRRDDLVHVQSNEARFAALDVLYLWAGAGDVQFMYETSSPHRVWSFDHGMFFTRQPDRENEPEWSLEDLSCGHGFVTRDYKLTGLQIPNEVYHPIAARLKSVTPRDVAAVVVGPPASWGFSPTARVAVAKYLWARREHTLERLRGEGRLV